MQSYKSITGKESGVTGYQIGTTYIVVRFSTGDTYKYTYRSAGEQAIEDMKQCALAKSGLSTYISQHNPPYAQKI